ncbi:MAG: Uncharacterised protein [Hyphomonas sp. TMED17]|nr:MAG: Uncharacterised protein [Hyphomonas sp. TMED17]
MADFISPEPFEKYGFIDTVNEFRSKMPRNCMHDSIGLGCSELALIAAGQSIGPEITSHDNHCVFKVDRPSLSVRQATIIEDLQQCVE